jgi:hypothetical protein
MRFAFVMAAVAGTSAVAAGLAAPAPAAAPVAAAVATPAPSVKHVIHYVRLAPGRTAPPQSTVKQLPAPSPVTKVVTTTRQSGKP